MTPQDTTRTLFNMESPQSMLLSSDQDLIMGMPNFTSFMHQQVRIWGEEGRKGGGGGLVKLTVCW